VLNHSFIAHSVYAPTLDWFIVGLVGILDIYLPKAPAACDTQGIAPQITAQATVPTHGAFPLAKS